MRIRIIQLLRERPSNTNQVSIALGIDYKTAEHHLKVLRENHVIAPASEGYGAIYLLTHEMEAGMNEFDVIAARVRAPPKSRETQPETPP